jgi:hypothetical protein
VPSGYVVCPGDAAGIHIPAPTGGNEAVAQATADTAHVRVDALNEPVDRHVMYCWGAFAGEIA